MENEEYSDASYDSGSGGDDYYEEPWDESKGPDPNAYEDYNDWVEAQIDHKIAKHTPTGLPAGQIKEEVSQGVKDAITPQLTPAEEIGHQVAQASPDDELREKRNESISWIEDCRHKAEQARARGDLRGERDWRERAQWGVKDIQRMGPSEAERFASEVDSEIDHASIKNFLLNQETSDDPVWESPKMQHDSNVVLIRSNKRAKSGKIVLPKESSPYGNITATQPVNMMEINLPDDQYKAWRDSVYSSGLNEGDHDALFRKSWSVLRQMGFGSAGKPVIEKAADNPDESDDPNTMSMKRFSEWREQQENERRGGPKKGFVFPRRRQGA